MSRKRDFRAIMTHSPDQIEFCSPVNSRRISGRFSLFEWLGFCVRTEAQNKFLHAPRVVSQDHAVGFDDDRGGVVVGNKRPRPPTTDSAAVDMAAAVPVPPRQRTSSVPLSADSSRFVFRSFCRQPEPCTVGRWCPACVGKQNIVSSGTNLPCDVDRFVYFASCSVRCASLLHHTFGYRMLLGARVKNTLRPETIGITR